MKTKTILASLLVCFVYLSDNKILASPVKMTFQHANQNTNHANFTFPFVITQDHKLAGIFSTFSNNICQIVVLQRQTGLALPKVVETYITKDAPKTGNSMFQARLVIDAFNAFLTNSNLLIQLQKPHPTIHQSNSFMVFQQVVIISLSIIVVCLLALGLADKLLQHSSIQAKKDVE